MEELILNKAKDLFFSHGLKTVTMDDIAKGVGVSKKTIYESFSNKNEILTQVVKNFLACYNQGLEENSSQAEDAIEEVIQSAQLVVQTIHLVNQNFFYDLEKSFPEAWILVTGYRQKILLPSIVLNLQHGTQEEMYRPELDIPFVADLRVQQFMTVFNPLTITHKKLQSSKLLLQLTEFYLHGITTLKGKKMINKYLNVNNEKQYFN